METMKKLVMVAAIAWILISGVLMGTMIANNAAQSKAMMAQANNQKIIQVTQQMAGELSALKNQDVDKVLEKYFGKPQAQPVEK